MKARGVRNHELVVGIVMELVRSLFRLERRLNCKIERDRYYTQSMDAFLRIATHAIRKAMTVWKKEQ